MKDITFTVKYKTGRRLFWRRIKKVAADGIIDLNGVHHRWFVLVDGQRWEIPTDNTRFHFGAERALLAKEIKEEEIKNLTGQ